MQRIFSIILLAGVVLTGCGGSQPAAPAKPATPAPEIAHEAPNDVPPMRNFAGIKVGPYDVQPMFEEEIVDGHYSIAVKGGEVKAVRIWVGPEDAAGVMVVKTEIENTYHHGHVEVPNPVPADAMLWVELESPSGETIKGSTPLKLAS